MTKHRLVRGCSRSKEFCLDLITISGGFSKQPRGPWSLVDSRLDRAFIVNGLECSENFCQMMREVLRVWRIVVA